MKGNPFTRREFQTTLNGETLSFYPAPNCMYKEWKQEVINDHTNAKR